ncbi:hypothetical protein FM125_09480 [Micrococcus lylae]|uniref:Uncharacterized protein n=1 Tax=Micrococcus lylae TaxID=1273 RepID=A0A1R4JMQ6_9MICC|nr:hypothetical protein FM125_09480 [Micrococcus lylae]
MGGCCPGGRPWGRCAVAAVVRRVRVRPAAQCGCGRTRTSASLSVNASTEIFHTFAGIGMNAGLSVGDAVCRALKRPVEPLS